MELQSGALTDKCSISSDADKGPDLVQCVRLPDKTLSYQMDTVSGDGVYRVVGRHCLRRWRLQLSDSTVSSGGVYV